MRHGHPRRSQRMMTPEIADRLLESLRPTRHLLTRMLADIPIGGPEYRQIDRVVQEIDGLADILIGDGTHYHQKVHSVPKPDRGMEANRHSKTQGHAAGSGRDGHSRRAISGNRQLPK